MADRVAHALLRSPLWRQDTKQQKSFFRDLMSKSCRSLLRRSRDFPNVMFKPRLAPDMPSPLRAKYFNTTSRIVRVVYEELPSSVSDEAQDLIRDGRCIEAQEVVKRFPTWDATYLGHLIMGNAYQRLERLEEADEEWLIADAIQAFVSAHRASVIRTNLAATQFFRARYGKAVELCDEAIARFAEWSGPWVNKLASLNKEAALSPTDFQTRQADFARSVFAEMDRLWPNWRSDDEFAKSLANDPHLVGLQQYSEPPRTLRRLLRLRMEPT